MSLHGFARQRDANEPLIVAVYEALGATVQRMSDKGVPDLLVGYQGGVLLVEVKRPEDKARKQRAGSLTPDQVDWLAGWRGSPVPIVRTPEDAVRTLRCGASAFEGSAAGIWTRCVAGVCDGTWSDCEFRLSHRRGTYPRVLDTRSKAR